MTSFENNATAAAAAAATTRVGNAENFTEGVVSFFSIVFLKFRIGNETIMLRGRHENNNNDESKKR